MTLAKDKPEVFDGPKMLEAKYGHINKGKTEQAEPRTFFRENKSAEDIIKLANETNFKRFTDSRDFQLGLFSQELDVGVGCGDSCEIGADDSKAN